MKIGKIVDPEELRAKGYCVKHGCLTKQESEHFLSLIQTYQQMHNIPQVYRKRRGRSLNYKVIDGEKIREHLPEIEQLYQDVNQAIHQHPRRTPLLNATQGKIMHLKLKMIKK